MKDTMMIHSTHLQGEITVPPSKSMAHRAIICASLAKGRSIVRNISYSKDLLATINMCEAIGAKITKFDDYLQIDGRMENYASYGDCFESGSTLRFFIPIVKHFFNEFKLYGKPSLIQRPLSEYENLFKDEITIHEDYVYVQGGLIPQNYEVYGGVSSQFISGLLFVLPLLNNDSTITITGEIESKSYILMTIDVLKTFGIDVEFKNNVIYIQGNQIYKATDYTVEGDYSQAAFFYIANELGANLRIMGLNNESLQGDRVLIDIINENRVEIDASNCPDLIPILSVYCALQNKRKTRIYNTRRLRFKESDRVQSTCDLISSLGGKIKASYNEIVIEGIDSFKSCEVHAHNDHRIAMAAAIASLKTNGSITLINPNCVDKSYPNFWEEFKRLGGELNE